MTLAAGDGFLHVVLEDGTVSQCPLIDEPFPDTSDFLESLPTAVHHCMIDRKRLLRTIEQRPLERLGLRLTSGGMQVLLPDHDADLDGTRDGSELTLWFELTTLHPAVTNALGNDLILDVTAPDQPVVLRQLMTETSPLSSCRARHPPPNTDRNRPP